MSELKNKLNANAKHFRYLSRAETFNRNRRSVEELDYLKYYTPHRKEAILASLEAPIPSPLPPLSPQTISFYRRSSQPLYRTKAPDSLQIDAHMLYESLWILASVEDKLFENYQAVVKEFELELPTYLLVNSGDIREMAVIAAGNKIIGREADILRIVEADSKQLWVLVNHILDKKIPFRALMPYINTPNEIVFKTLYELTIAKEDEAVLAITADDTAPDTVVAALRSPNEEIVKYAIRIIGNIVADQGQHADVFYKRDLAKSLVELLWSASEEVRRDACWLAANLCCDRQSATRIIRHQAVMGRLVELFSGERSLEIQRELTYIFAHLAHFAQKNEAFALLAHENVLGLCYAHLCLDDNEVTSVTLYLLSQLLDLGETCKDESQTNLFCAMIGRMGDLRSQISEKSYSENDQVSHLSLEIMNFIEDNYE